MHQMHTPGERGERSLLTICSKIGYRVRHVANWVWQFGLAVPFESSLTRHNGRLVLQEPRQRADEPVMAILSFL
jgi:hypothetical protein